MANPSRKMATIRRVSKVSPIEGADRIEAVRVDGWTVVDRVGMWKEGDLCVFYEVDTFLPKDNENYAFLAERGTCKMVIDGEEVEGHKLRTAKLRGVYSQGLLMKPEQVMPDGMPESRYAELCDEGHDVSSIVGVCEYYKPMPAMNAGFIGRYDPYVAPRTDAERVQNIDQETFDLIKRTEYEASIKVDGTSITLLYDDRKDCIRIFSHNNEFDISTGVGKIAYDCAKEQGLIDFCEANHMTTLQCELCGPKIQSDRLALGKHKLFVFSVWDVKGAEYISNRMVRFLDNSGFVVDSHVPIISPDEPYVNTGRTLSGFATPQDFLDMAEDIRGAVTPGRLDEGIVIHIYGRGDLDADEWARVQGALGPTLQMKAVSNKYLLKSKE